MSSRMEEVGLNIDFSDLKPSAVTRLLRESVTRELGRRKMSSKQEPSDDSDDDDEESESDKLVKLQEETKGKPAPIPVSTSDFSKDTMRKAMSNLPAAKKKGRKA